MHSTFRTPLVVGIAALAGLAAVARAEAPYDFDAAAGRLPKSVVPQDYRIAIEPDIDAGTLQGRETISLQVRTATETIVFNSLNETLDHVLFDGKPAKAVASDDEKQLTTVTLARAAAPGIHTLSFSYRGRIESGPVGLFVQPFVAPDGSKGRLLSTQFESTDARRAFPCWDEPAFRATFQLTATIPAQWQAVSNMPVASRTVKGKRATVRFERSPRMASYLVEFTAGELGHLSGSSGKTKLGVWTVRGQEKSGAVALENASRILADYNDYFGYAFPLPKLDSIAVPGGFTGAMENWGAITYNDQLLVLGPSSTLGNRQDVFSVQAHEMAHQWFGDLVTMGWWDNLWLNESFASWMAARETDRRNPDWKWWEREDASKERAMGADARATSHPVQQAVESDFQVMAAVDPEITYDKGQAVLRMLEAYLGPDVFRAGIRRYMADRALSNATSADLWNALGAASGRDVRAIAHDWIDQAGFPLVRAEATCDAAGTRSVRLTQQRFLLGGGAPGEARWNVPLQVRIAANAPAQSVLLPPAGLALAAGRCADALSLNAGAVGFYRSAYDAATLQAITRDFGSLPDADRIVLLDDQWALVEAGALDLSAYLSLAGAMGTNLDQRAWEQITDALGTIEGYERGGAGHDAYADHARRLIRPVADRLGTQGSKDEAPELQRLRRDVLGDLGVWGDADVIAQMRARFASFVKDPGSVAPDDQSVMLRVVAFHADAATFEQLHALARQARNETEVQRYFGALALVRDPALAEQAAQIALSSELPPQAGQLRLGLIARLAEEHPQLAWNTFTANVDALMAPMQNFAPLILAQYVPQIFWNAIAPDQLEAWVKQHVPADLAANVARGMETARFRLDEKIRLARAADAYLGGLAGTAH